GFGKSTLLKAMTRHFEKEWVVVRFNAWEHQRLDTPWWWLIAAIERDGRSALRKISKRRRAEMLVADVVWRVGQARTDIVLAAFAIALALGTWRLLPADYNDFTDKLRLLLTI